VGDRSRGRYATPADSLLHAMVPCTEGYAYDLGVWDLSIVQGPFSVAPVPTLQLLFATFASLCHLRAHAATAARCHCWSSAPPHPRRRRRRRPHPPPPAAGTPPCAARTPWPPGCGPRRAGTSPPAPSPSANQPPPPAADQHACTASYITATDPCTLYDRIHAPTGGVRALPLTLPADRRRLTFAPSVRWRCGVGSCG
jgi:hypothetical protein